MIIVLTIIKLLKMFFNICDVLFPHFCLLKKKPLTEKRSNITDDDKNTFFTGYH